MSIQITGNIVVLMRTLLILLRKLKCVIFQWWEGPHFLKNIVEYNNRLRKQMKGNSAAVTKGLLKQIAI